VTVDLSACRDACQACQTICAETAIHCLVKAQAHPRDLVRLLWDCAEICGISANFMSRGSPRHAITCRACTAICDESARACVGSGDPILERCAEQCRECARLCGEMAQA
jgi:hypothetical protein